MGSSWPRNWTRVSCIEPPLLREDSLPAELPGRPPLSLPKLPLHFWEFWAAAQYNFCRTLVPDLVLSDSPALVLLPSPTSHPLRSSRFASALWNPLKFHLQGPASTIDWNPSSGEVWFSKPYIRRCKVTDIYICIYTYILYHSVAQLWPTLCDPMSCSTPGFPVLYHFPELTQTHVHWVSDVIQPSHPLSSPFLPVIQSFPASGSFPMSQLFKSGGQSIGPSVSASVLPMNIQGWFPLGLTALISLRSKGLVMVESSDKKWSTGEENGKPLQHSCLRTPWTVWKGKKIYSIYENISLSGCTGLSGGTKDLLVAACGIYFHEQGWNPGPLY